jgi:hypothetical protein
MSPYDDPHMSAGEIADYLDSLRMATLPSDYTSSGSEKVTITPAKMNRANTITAPSSSMPGTCTSNLLLLINLVDSLNSST